MFRIRIRSFLLPALLVLSSCSIKEDRSGCPCLLTVDLTKVLDTGITPPSWWDRGLTLVLYSGDREFDRMDCRYEEARPEYEFKVPKGDVGVSGILGLSAGTLSGRAVRYPEGVESDRLFVSGQTVACYGETARAVLEMNKQFSQVEIAGLETFDERMEVTAGSSGLDVLTCEALEGRFRFPLACGDDGLCRFRMPRQQTDDLMILMYDGSGRLDNSIPLGKYLTAIGYDWTAPSLADVSIRIDYVAASIQIVVGDWTEVFEFPYVL